MSNKISNWTNKYSVTLYLLSTFIICAWIYRHSFGGFFFQDDWFTFRISQSRSFSDFLGFFVPRTDVIYYRPLGMQVPYFLLRTIFSLNPVPYKLLTYIIHLFNTYLVYLLLSKILKKKNIAIFASFLYATSAVHFIPFYWFATFPFVLGPLIFNLSAVLYICFLNKKNISFYSISLTLFGIGLFVNEIVISLPIIISIYQLLTKKIGRLLYLLPYYLAAGIILSVRFLIFSVPVGGDYHLGVGWHMLSNLKTYIFWSFNWSEIATEQMVKPFIFNSLIMDKYSYSAYIFIFSFAVFITLIFAGLYLLFRSNQGKSDLKLIMLGLLWFAFGLMPVLLLAGHKFPYYLPISLTGILITVTVLQNRVFTFLENRSKLISKMTMSGILYLWVVTSMTAVNLNIKEHWAPRRSNLSRNLLNAGIYFQNMVTVSYSSENKLALNDQDAFNLIYGADTLTVYEK